MAPGRGGGQLLPSTLVRAYSPSGDGDRSRHTGALARRRTRNRSSSAQHRAPSSTATRPSVSGRERVGGMGHLRLSLGPVDVGVRRRIENHVGRVTSAQAARTTSASRISQLGACERTPQIVTGLRQHRGQRLPQRSLCAQNTATRSAVVRLTTSARAPPARNARPPRRPAPSSRSSCLNVTLGFQPSACAPSPASPRRWSTSVGPEVARIDLDVLLPVEVERAERHVAAARAPCATRRSRPRSRRACPAAASATSPRRSRRRSPSRACASRLPR